MEFRVTAIPCGFSPYTGEALGWLFYTYRADQTLPGAIDMDRKLTWQKPI